MLSLTLFHVDRVIECAKILDDIFSIRSLDKMSKTVHCISFKHRTHTQTSNDVYDEFKMIMTIWHLIWWQIVLSNLTGHMQSLFHLEIILTKIATAHLYAKIIVSIKQYQQKTQKTAHTCSALFRIHLIVK